MSGFAAEILKDRDALTKKLPLYCFTLSFHIRCRAALQKWKAAFAFSKAFPKPCLPALERHFLLANAMDIAIFVTVC